MTWITTAKASDLLGFSERAIRSKADKGEYKSRYIPSSTGQGGKKLEILLETLPEYAQRAYYNEKGEFPHVINVDYTFTKAQREKGELRAEAVQGFRKYFQNLKKTQEKVSKTQAMKDYVAQWNTEHPDFPCTVKSLYDWMKRSKSGNVERLADKRGGYNRGKSTIPEEYQKYFSSLYLQQTKPTVESCFKETQRLANVNGDIIPGIKAFRLYAKNIPTAVLTLHREGKKAFEDTCEYYTERDYLPLSPNDWWVSDHHLWDVFVRVPDGTGGWKLERPWGSYWMDMRTRKMMSSVIRIEAPNSDIVLCSFGLGVEQFGVPKGVRLDNGKDYKAKDLFVKDRYTCSEKEVEGIRSSLSINLAVERTYAIPYNAKAKPIERVFNTFEEQLGKKYPSYAGSNAKKRPEDLKNLDIMDVITLDEFIAQHDTYVYEVYNYSPHSGEAMYNKSPDYMYNTLGFNPRKVPKNVLFFCMMRVKGARTVGRNGITFNGIHFYNKDFIYIIGQKVLAKYEPTKPEILYVFDLNENFLFIAEEVKKLGWNLTKEDYQKENKRKKEARQAVLNYTTKDSKIRSAESIGERLNLLADSMEAVPERNTGQVQLIRNEKMEQNAKRFSLSDAERAYQDTISRQEAEKNKSSQQQNQYAERFKQKMLKEAFQNQA